MIDVVESIVSDWKRYTGLHDRMHFLLFMVVIFRNPGMFFSLLYRMERYLLTHAFFPIKIVAALLYPFYFICTYYILSIDISPRVKIGKGLYLHNRGIVFTDKVTTGNNLSIIGPVTLGTKGLGKDFISGPTLGNNVTVYTGARIIGALQIGNNVLVGSNAVVTKNVPSNSVVAGVPGKIIKRLTHFS